MRSLRPAPLRPFLRGAVLAGLFLAFGLALGLAAPAGAQGAEGFAFGLGEFDVGKSFTATEAAIEYRWRPFELWSLELEPTVGFAATADEGYWAHAGFRWDIPTGTSRWIPTLGFAVTAYEQGDGKNLGGTLQFRSAFELAYRLDSGHRLGLVIYHLSNASIHELNPGSESVLLTYSLGR